MKASASRKENLLACQDLWKFHLFFEEILGAQNGCSNLVRRRLGRIWGLEPLDVEFGLGGQIPHEEGLDKVLDRRKRLSEVLGDVESSFRRQEIVDDEDGLPPLVEVDLGRADGRQVVGHEGGGAVRAHEDVPERIINDKFKCYGLSELILKS